MSSCWDQTQSRCSNSSKPSRTNEPRLNDSPFNEETPAGQAAKYHKKAVFLHNVTLMT